MPTHRDRSEELVRPPGMPPSQCTGEKYRVDGSGDPIDWDAEPYWDDCLPWEGEAGKKSAIRLERCRRCSETSVVARGPDGTEWLRNAWSKSEPETAAAAVA